MMLNLMVPALIGMAERGHLPDVLVRAGIRRLLRARLRSMQQQSGRCADGSCHAAPDPELLRAPVAVMPEAANAQHYEVPAEFFAAVLGKHLKYSCCFWEHDDSTLDEAEAAALQITCERAGLCGQQDILELGCGWGSLSLWMAARYPDSRITAVSNSVSQKAWIDSQATQRGLKNLQVITADINAFHPAGRFDRVVSVEMFEHVRNHTVLMQRIADWLRPDGRLFVHIFCHDHQTYLFEDTGPASWMARHFFSGGMMPSRDLLRQLPHPLRLENEWQWDGTHYERTSNAWLSRMDQNLAAVRSALSDGSPEPELIRHRWRMFFMSCAELFGFLAGTEWYVSHYLFRKPG